MSKQLSFRIILQNSITGVVYGLQKGKGISYVTLQQQTGDGSDLVFDFEAEVRIAGGADPVFIGPFVQGTTKVRFIYIDIGAYGGQSDGLWNGRLKIPLTGISSQLIEKSLKNGFLLATVSGIGKGGRPCFGTVNPFTGWSVIEKVL